jgi:cell division protein FtsQ
VHQVTINGYDQADQAEVVRAIQIGAASGDALHLPVQAIRAAVAPMPWVENVTVTHDWPRGVRVNVTQATAAIVAFGSGKRWLVSSRGRVLGLDTTHVAGLPTMSVGELTVGEWLKNDRAVGVKLTAALSPDVRGAVRALHLDSAGLLVGRMANGRTVLRFGPPVDLWRKGRALDAVLANAETRKLAATATYLDLSAADAPVFGGLETDASQASTTSGDSLSGSTEPSTLG